MIKVTATSESRRSKTTIKELGRLANPGEEFFVTPERYEILAGNNGMHAIFVTRSLGENTQTSVLEFPSVYKIPDDKKIVYIDGSAYMVDLDYEVPPEKAQVVEETKKKTSKKRKTTSVDTDQSLVSNVPDALLTNPPQEADTSNLKPISPDDDILYDFNNRPTNISTGFNNIPIVDTTGLYDVRAEMEQLIRSRGH